MMELIKFIKEHEDWRERLSKEPYALKIREDEGYTLFMYDQIKSNFYTPIVKEARGVILDLSGRKPRVVCRAFDKFGNFGEGYVDEIDWDSARVQEKVDGSIVKLWFDRGEWRISSNGCIDAFKAELSSGFSIGDLFVSLFDDFLWDKLEKEYTYIFELVSPYNKVVVDYGVSKLYLIGKRHNESGREVIPEDLGMARPAEYYLTSLEECIKAAEALNSEESEEVKAEGFVVVDKNFHRIKVKSPLYVAQHHIKTKQPNLADLVLIYKRNEWTEFLNYFPVYKEKFAKINTYFVNLKIELVRGQYYWDYYMQDRRSFAEKMKDNKYRGWMWEAIKYDDWSYERVMELPHEQLARIVKKFYEGEEL